MLARVRLNPAHPCGWLYPSEPFVEHFRSLRGCTIERTYDGDPLVVLGTCEPVRAEPRSVLLMGKYVWAMVLSAKHGLCFIPAFHLELEERAP